MPTLLQITPIDPGTQAEIDKTYDVVRAELSDIDAAWLAARGGTIDGVVTGGHLGLPNGVIEAMPKLRIIAINGVGFDKVDLDFAKRHGVRVSNTPDVLTEDVADLAIGLTLSLLRRLPHAHAHVRAGRWPEGEVPLARKLSGKRVGIVGLGRIGRAAAVRFAGFTDRIAYTDVVKHDVPYEFLPDPVALADRSEVFVVCAAASEKTRRMIGRPVFDAIGPDGVLVNVARGSLIDEPALVAALVEGRLGGAALDVFENEPHVPEALRTMENVVVTPHIASATRETRRAMGRLMLDNIDACFGGTEMPTALV